jgi:periplasmic protein TonB
MRTAASTAVAQNGPTATGWLLSCLLHGGVVMVALLFVHRLQVLPETESFQWNVAMVATPIHSPMSPSSPASSMSPSRSAQPTPSVTQSVRPSTEAHVPISQSAISPQLVDRATRQQDIPTSSSMESAPPTPVEPSTKLESTSESLHSVPDSSNAPQTDLETPSLSSIASIPSTSLSPDATQSKPARTDYGWLADLMAKWIEDLNKRYPAMLRTEGIQGKVTLTAMLHEDGVLSDVRIAKSSGNKMLDDVALEDVRNGPPIKLSRPLERPHMPVKFSISYDLKTVR